MRDKNTFIKQTNTFQHRHALMWVTLLRFYLLLSFSLLGPGITPDLRRQVNIVAAPHTHRRIREFKYG